MILYNLLKKHIVNLNNIEINESNEPIYSVLARTKLQFIMSNF